MTVPEWLRRVEPPVPESFVPRLAAAVAEGARRTSEEADVPAGGDLPEPGRLLDAAAEALGRSLSPEERERQGAYDLLAADALVTWAAEAALGKDDPEGVLQGMVDGLARGERAPGGVTTRCEDAPGPGRE